MAFFKLSSISQKQKRFRTFEWYFRKYLTIEVILAKYEEIRNFATLRDFKVARSGLDIPVFGILSQLHQ